MAFNTQYNHTDIFKNDFGEYKVVETPYPLDTKNVLKRYLRGEQIDCASNTPRVCLSNTFFNGFETRDKLRMVEEVKKAKQQINDAKNDFEKQNKDFIDAKNKQLNQSAQ